MVDAHRLGTTPSLASTPHPLRHRIRCSTQQSISKAQRRQGSAHGVEGSVNHVPRRPPLLCRQALPAQALLLAFPCFSLGPPTALALCKPSLLPAEPGASPGYYLGDVFGLGPVERSVRTNKASAFKGAAAQTVRSNEQSLFWWWERCIPCERTNKVRRDKEMLPISAAEWACGRRDRKQRAADPLAERAAKPRSWKLACKKVWWDSYPSQVSLPVRPLFLFVAVPHPADAGRACGCGLP